MAKNNMPPKKAKTEHEDKSTVARMSYQILYVKDMPSAVKFYSEVLGWKVWHSVKLCLFLLSFFISYLAHQFNLLFY